MKIVYDALQNVRDIEEKLKNASFRTEKSNRNETLKIFEKDNQLFLEITTGRRTTRYKLVITDEYIQFKYSGLFSWVNIILSIFWVVIPMVLGLFLLICMVITKDFSDWQAIIVPIPICAGFLWLVIIEHRILAKKYMKKVCT